MSKNRQAKPTQVKNIIHTVLMIINPSPVTIQLRNRIITQRNSKDQIGIVTEKPNMINKSSTTREIIFNVNLKNESALANLVKSQGFDTVYIELKDLDPTLMNNIVKAIHGIHVKRIILSVNAENQQNASQISQACKMIKQSGISYTIIHQAKLNRYDLISYQVVKDAQPVNDSTVSPSSVADLIYQIIKHPHLQSDVDLGIAQLPYK